MCEALSFGHRVIQVKWKGREMQAVNIFCDKIPKFVVAWNEYVRLRLLHAIY